MSGTGRAREDVLRGVGERRKGKPSGGDLGCDGNVVDGGEVEAVVG